ncbi:unnamed protein product [Knipowitschia caucasica]|uniref:Ubiquitin-like domain-containing protein n=1 Tax=Knipowitschia caucasica TaxID=637954 RepID=A0AAV2LJI2_KNICA
MEKEEEEIKIMIKTYKGKVALSFDSQKFQRTTVLDLKKTLGEMEEAPPPQCTLYYDLVYKGHVLQDHQLLSEVILERNTVIHMIEILELHSGGTKEESLGQRDGQNMSMECLAVFDQPQSRSDCHIL